MSSFSEIFVERECIETPLSMFSSQTSPLKFSQIYESFSITFASSKYQNFDLPVQHVDNVSIDRETFSRKRHRNLSSSTFSFGICVSINSTKLCVPVDSLSINDSIKFLEKLKQGFKRATSWNKYKSEITRQPKSNNLDQLND